jgi:hypothetical protein
MHPNEIRLARRGDTGRLLPTPGLLRLYYVWDSLSRQQQDALNEQRVRQIMEIVESELRS